MNTDRTKTGQGTHAKSPELEDQAVAAVRETGWTSKPWWDTAASGHRRRVQLGFFMAIVAPFCFIFGTSNYFAGDIWAAILGYASGLAFVFTLAGLKFFERPWRWFRVSIGFLSLLLLYLILTGAHGGSTVLWLYPYALLLVHLMGSREGALWISALFLPTMVFLLHPDLLGTVEYDFAFVIRFLASFGMVAVFAYSIEFFRNSAEERLRQKHQSLLEEQVKLAKAYEDIKVLSGIVPICSWCKKIRDDEGIWNQLESYITQHSDAGFSHGICPACMEKHYPDIDGPEESAT